jgi:photosystem II stability/assembly factor-like uncharacterized protein
MFSCLLVTFALFTSQNPRTDPDQMAGQEDQRLSSSQQRLKFEPAPVMGTPALDRARAYAVRLKAEADSPFSAIKWRNVGPERQGGRVEDIASPLGDPQTLYVAYATGGLYRTRDDGASWTSLFDGQASFGIGAIAVSRDGNTLWVGTGEPNSQRTSYAGDGVYKSTDGGRTWTNMGLSESQHIGRILIDPSNPDVVWVAALGHLYSQNPDRGVYKTIDGGKTWRQVLKVDDYTGSIDLVMDWRHPDSVIASMWDRDRRAWDFRNSGKGSAVYRTSDGGRNWSRIAELPTGDDAGRTGLANCWSKPNVVYAYVDNSGEDPDWESLDEHVPSGRLTPRRLLLLNEQTFVQVDAKVLDEFFRRYPPGDRSTADVVQAVKDKKLTMARIKALIETKNPRAFQRSIAGTQVYRSDDFGRTWRRTTGGRLGQFSGYYYGTVWVDPKDENDLYVTGVFLLRSRDGGKTWKQVFSQAHVDFHAVCYDRRNPERAWAGCDGGLYLTSDGGDTCKAVNDLPVGQATTLALDNHYPYRIYVGMQDNGTMRGPSTYRPGKSDPNDWEELYGGDGSDIAVDPRSTMDLVYVAAQFGDSMAVNKKTLESWNTRPNTAKGEPASRFNWVSPLILSPHSPEIVYNASQRVYRSFDQGRHWTAISPDLTKNLPDGNVPYSTIKTLSESPLRFGLIYAGCDDGNVQMTSDGGFQWISIPTPEPKLWVSRIVASKWDEATVYCSQSGYRADDFKAYLWKSTDYGKTWRSVVGDLPAETVNTVREDPIRKDLLYAGTDMGVYVTFDGGLHWEPLQGGIPHTPVHDLAVQEREKDLVAATHSRSAWVLPLKWVYALTPEIRKADLSLFDIDDISRSANWGYENREPWNTSPLPVRAAHVNFYTRSPGTATVELAAKDGKVLCKQTLSAVLGFNFVDLSLELKPWKPGSVDVAKRVVKTVADALGDPREPERPQYVAAGSYTVSVTVNGHTVQKPFRLTAD